MKESPGRLIRRVAILAMLVIVGFTSYWVIGAVARVATPRPTYKVGDVLTWLPTRGSHTVVRTTVIMFGSSKSSACRESIPLNKQINDAVIQHNRTPIEYPREHTDVMLLMDVAGHSETEVKFAAEFGLGRVWVADYSKPDPKLLSLPTYLVLDESSKVLFVSQGMTPEKVATIKALIARP
jgi:hypothetical protein